MSIFNQINLAKIIDPNLVFEASPSSEGLYLYSLIIYGLLLVAAIILGVISRRDRQSIYRKLWRQLIYLLLFTGLVGPVLVFLRWQSIPYIGSRLMVLVLWIITVAWLAQIITYKIWVLPKEIKKIKEKEKFEKYLPRA